MKKLKLEDTCLTIEQVRELQSLGIDFSNAVMEFTHYDNDGADEWFLTQRPLNCAQACLVGCAHTTPLINTHVALA